MGSARTTIKATVSGVRSWRGGSRVLFAATLGAVALVCTACGGSSPSATAGTPAQLLSAGLAAQRSGNYTAAAADYKAVVSAAPTSSDACYAYYDLGVINQVDVSPANPAAAESYYRKCLALNPNFSDALYNLAIILTKSDPAQAESDYSQVVALAPTSVASAPAYVNLGFLLIAQGEKAQGIRDIQLAASLNPAFLKDVAAAEK